MWQIASFSKEKQADNEQFIRQLIQTLPQINPLPPKYLETAKEGNAEFVLKWMDEMKKFGVKHVSFVLEFKWRNNHIKTSDHKEDQISSGILSV